MAIRARRALALNLLTSLTSVLGGVVAYFALGTALHLLPYALAFAASSFIYVAVADLIPGLHRRVDLGPASSRCCSSGSAWRWSTSRTSRMH